MRLTFLGTGTSFGIPVIGCDCAVCASDDPRDRRSWRLAVGDLRPDLTLLLTHPESQVPRGLREARPGVSPREALQREWFGIVGDRLPRSALSEHLRDRPEDGGRLIERGYRSDRADDQAQSGADP